MRDQIALIRMGKDFVSMPDDQRGRFLADVDERFRVVHYRPEGDVAQTMGWLEAMIQTLVLRDGCSLIVIDPWNEVEHLPQPGETMTSYANWATKTLRQWAERLNVHIALVAHPRKMPTDGVPRVPTGYDIAESAAFFNKPSLGVTVHQRQKTDPETGETEAWVELKVWKVRDTRLYRFKKGSVDVVFDPERRRYRGRSKVRA